MTEPNIKSVSAVGDGHVLAVTWRNEAVEKIDVSSFVDEYAVLEPLADLEAFRKVKVGEDGWFVEWPDVSEDLGLSADTLWRLAREQANDIMPKVEFQAWRKRNGLSLSAAAGALGLSRRQIACYNSGEKLIPRYIALACVGYETAVANSGKTLASALGFPAGKQHMAEALPEALRLNNPR